MPPLTSNLIELAELLGPLPPGDTPAAWWASVDPDVLAGYERFLKDHRAWRNRMDKLYRISGLKANRHHPWKRGEKIRISGLGDSWLVGIYPPPGCDTPPRWWRFHKAGYLVPRRYTVAEKNSEVNKLFVRCRHIPRAVSYVPGMPESLWIPGAGPAPTHVYPVHLRRPGAAVLAFVGWPPAGADPPFEPDQDKWTQLKLSTWHLLRERQAAARGAAS